MPRVDADGSRLSSAGIDGVDNIWIARNAPLEALLFDRSTIGNEFAQLCLRASRHFLDHLRDDLADAARDGLSELLLLSKGYVYGLRQAAADLGLELGTDMLATSRTAVSGAHARVEVPYASLDTGARNLIIGDTIASGASMCAALDRYLEARRLDRVFIVSIAGTGQGAKVIVEFCDARGVEASVLLGLASFGLADNGFDLSFLHPDTICDPAYRDRARGAFHGRPVSSPGWDFGSQALAVEKYRALCWVEARYWGLERTDLFAVAKQPTDRRQVQKEYAAFRDRFPDLEGLLSRAA